LNLDVFHAGEDDLAPIPKTARTFPMMAKRRVIVLGNCELIGEDKARNKALAVPAGFQDTLAELAKEKIDTCCIILYGRKYDRRNAFARAAKENEALIELGRPTPQQAASWARIMAEERKKKLSAEAIGFLTQQFGADLRAIDCEIEKAALYVGTESDRIEAADIRAVMTAPKTENIFSLMDAVGEKNRAKAFYFLDGMLETGNKPLTLLSSMTGHVRKLLRAKVLLEKGMAQGEVIQTIGGNPYAAEKAIDQSKNHTTAGLKRAMLVLSETDFELKNGRVSDRIILEKMILDLCRSSGVS